jgi:hypothetical protein
MLIATIRNPRTAIGVVSELLASISSRSATYLISLVTSYPSAASRSSSRLVVRSTNAWSGDSVLIQ